MENKGHYNPLGIQIEGYIRKEYESSVEALKQATSLEQSLVLIATMFECLGKSCTEPGRGRVVDWMEEMIGAYRTLGEIFNDAYSSDYSKIQELSQKYPELLNFNGDTNEEKIEQGLKYLLEIKTVLEEYEINNEKELETKLERLNSLEEDPKNIEYLEELKRKVERAEDNFS